MNPLFALTSTMLPASARVVAFNGREALSELYRFEIDITMSHADSEDFDMAAAVNTTATLTVCNADGQPARATGEVRARVWVRASRLGHARR